jgi:hypothetical protein
MSVERFMKEITKRLAEALDIPVEFIEERYAEEKEKRKIAVDLDETVRK